MISAYLNGFLFSQVEVMIPGPKVGLIIGKGGETIKQLQVKTSVRILVRIKLELCEYLVGEIRNKDGGCSRWPSTRK